MAKDSSSSKFSVGLALSRWTLPPDRGERKGCALKPRAEPRLSPKCVYLATILGLSDSDAGVPW